ncbi:hypothetical protein E2P81_ATG06937 [Venturia nashicola]|uniref:Uncharacterized protein n=1 Tax=Venturia nashicola TaxID=86259 RepID=A0A4Z1PDB2_9PEZI|nr:hypothetical protein E6O75_ATG07107 [Venturia nashicola]TLD30284.1 hypothetical protein E2P81_ATG06937 [Venturia nashicola]
MAPSTPRLRILSVGGNPVSAFLSWRLQATNACDVTLVWKSNFDSVAQYGISMKSATLGNERFKPYAVVPAAEDAQTSSKAPFDYVLLCIKALPDVYDIANIIQSVVSPQHTCILLNTTGALGIEEYVAQRFPTNVVLSLVSGADIVQVGTSEFEHRGTSSDIWVGWATQNSRIPHAIQKDMAEALAMTLSTGRVHCTVSENIRQQQFDRNIGPIAFHPASVLFECPSHVQLLEMPGVRDMITNTIDELVALAKGHGCTFAPDFREKTIAELIQPTDRHTIMYQDFENKRPMEVETFLGSPIKLAKEVGLSVPRVEVMYALLHRKNTINQTKGTEAPTSPGFKPPPPRSSSVAGNGPRPIMNGSVNGSGPMNGRRAPSYNGQAPMMRRPGPPPSNGYPPRMPNGHANGYPPEGPAGQRRPSLEDGLEDFSHLVMYDTVPDGGFDGSNGVYGDGAAHSMSTSDMALRERELALRQREIEFKERQMQMRRGPPPNMRRGPPPTAGGWEDDEDDDYFDPMAGSGPAQAMDENFDMMSITSRRNRKQPSQSNNRMMNGDMGPPPPRGRNLFGRGPKRTSARIMADIPNLQDNILDNPLMGYSSNRYGTVDRGAMGKESRQNSLTSVRLDELQRGGQVPYGAYGPAPVQRRQSQSPGNPLSPPIKRPSPPNGYPQHNGVPNGMNGMGNGRPSPPGVRQPVPRHPPGHGNAVAPQQVEQHAGVSNTYPQKQISQVRSLTGSASASAASGDSSGASAHLDSSNSSANSSTGLPGPGRVRPAVRA